MRLASASAMPYMPMAKSSAAPMNQAMPDAVMRNWAPRTAASTTSTVSCSAVVADTTTMLPSTSSARGTGGRCEQLPLRTVKPVYHHAESRELRAERDEWRTVALHNLAWRGRHGGRRVVDGLALPFRMRGGSRDEGEMLSATEGFTRAGLVGYRRLNIWPPSLPADRERHRFGEGPFGVLVMPSLPDVPGVYLWQEDEIFVYVGQTRTSLRERLGSRGYATISNFNTYARVTGKRNGGQQTNCRVNALANRSLVDGRRVSIWYRVTSPSDAAPEEGSWMAAFGKPAWNHRIEAAPDLSVRQVGGPMSERG